MKFLAILCFGNAKGNAPAGEAYASMDSQFPERILQPFHVQILCFGNAKGNAPAGEAYASMDSQFPERILQPFHVQLEDVAQHIRKLSILLSKIKGTNQESKEVTNASSITANKERMERHVKEVGRMAQTIKLKLEAIDADNLANREKPNCEEGSVIDRIRTNLTHGSSIKFRGVMRNIQILRESIEQEHRELIERRLVAVTGTIPDKETIDRLIETGKTGILYHELEAIRQAAHNKALYSLKEFEEMERAFRDIEKQLVALHQIYIDLDVKVEARGDMLQNIESQVGKTKNDIHLGMPAV